MTEILTRHSREQLRLFDLSDRELISIVDDVRGEDGWSARTDVAAAIFPFVRSAPETDRAKHAERCVAIRLGWMRRFGVLERNPDDGSTLSRWRLTEDGRALRMGTLTRGLATTLHGLNEFALMAAMGALSERYLEAGDVPANMMRREWLYGANRRNGGR